MVSKRVKVAVAVAVVLVAAVAGVYAVFFAGASDDGGVTMGDGDTNSSGEMTSTATETSTTTETGTETESETSGNESSEDTETNTSLSYSESDKTVDDVEYPAGANKDTIKVYTVASNHRDVLFKTDFRVTSTYQADRPSSYYEVTKTVASSYSQRRGLVTKSYLKRNESAEVVQDRYRYMNESKKFKKITGTNVDGTYYSVEDRGFAQHEVTGLTLSQMANFSYDAVGVRERNGESVVVYDVSPGVYADQVRQSNSTLQDFEGTLVLGENGVVHEASYRLVLETDSGVVEISSRFVVSEFGGVSVEKPSWVDEAEDQG